uniref:Peroxisomal membrane protein PEX14 n=1 Tax=Plectus sambesii TaxID=2011161 RepID=A0A914V544_9BILA
MPRQQGDVDQRMVGAAGPMVVQSRWRDMANTVVIIGGLSYAGYKVLRKFVLPRFFGVPDPEEEQSRRLEEQVNELHNSLKFVMDSVQQTLQSVQQQQESLNRALVLLAERDRSPGLGSHQMQELKTDVSIVKSLLLNRNQFAPLPTTDGPATLPAWQM